jgi:hypothetical protein
MWAQLQDRCAAVPVQDWTQATAMDAAVQGAMLLQRLYVQQTMAQLLLEEEVEEQRLGLEVRQRQGRPLCTSAAAMLLGIVAAQGHNQQVVVAVHAPVLPANAVPMRMHEPMTTFLSRTTCWPYVVCC